MANAVWYCPCPLLVQETRSPDSGGVTAEALQLSPPQGLPSVCCSASPKVMTLSWSSNCLITCQFQTMKLHLPALLWENSEVMLASELPVDSASPAIQYPFSFFLHSKPVCFASFHTSVEGLITNREKRGAPVRILAERTQH